MTSSTDALLEAILAELKAMRAWREAQGRPSAPSLSRADHDALSRLLPAIGGVFGSALFASAEVCNHEAPALRLVCEGLNVRQLGRLLRRAVDTPVGRHMVTREGAEAGAVLWRIVEVPEFPRNENVLVPHARSRGRV